MKGGEKITWAANMAALFDKGVLRTSSFLGSLKVTLGQDIWPLENFNLGHFCDFFLIFSIISVVTSRTNCCRTILGSLELMFMCQRN